ncbi:MAG: hypothetical protein HIU92_07745 [Proteobacteria bacterium]|nr:hypothetical protein [Pseudomonadota bacterium]
MSRRLGGTFAIPIAGPEAAQCGRAYTVRSGGNVLPLRMEGRTMINRRAPAVALATLLALGALSGTALAATGDESREAAALSSSTISLTQAIKSAEQQTGGRAYDAGVDLSGGQTRIVVETNGPKGVETVAINAQTGAVISTTHGGEAD